MRHAVIGIGSNSTRLLIGEIENGKMMPLQRMREGTRLFAGLENGLLSQESMLRAADAVARFVKAALDMGAGDMHVLATSAVRDAGNGGEFAALIEPIAGTPLEVLSGAEEARLSFLGATDGTRAGVLDIGGGSTEAAIGWDGTVHWADSAQLGAVRLLGEVPLLAGDGYEKALAIARARVEAIWTERDVRLHPALWYGVGGTITCLASLDMRLPAYDRDAVHGHTLGRETVENWARRLAKMSMAEREALPGMLATRADIIAHGAIVLQGAMEALDIHRITASNRSNLDGYLVSLAGRSAQDDGVEKVRAFYNASPEKEWARLESHFFEFEINRHFIDRYVKPGDRVLDVGGGPGRYSLYLAERGADVTLLDLSQANVDFACAQAKEKGLPLRGVCADARVLEEAVEGLYDAILLMGPLYHLVDEGDRVRTVEACLRRLKPGGVLFVAFISMIGGMIFAAREMPESILWEGEDVYYRKIVAHEDFAGMAFTSAFLVEPSHVHPFMARFPLQALHLVGSESITAPFHQQLAKQPPEVLDRWIQFALAVCEREDLLSYAEHLLYIGRKKEAQA